MRYRAFLELPALLTLVLCMACPPPTGDDDDDTPAGDCDGVDQVPGMDIDFEVVARGITEPSYITHAGDGSGRVFFTSLAGRVHVLDPAGDVEVYMNLSSLVSFSGEYGLLGLAFHPDFANNGRVFVHYSDVNGDTMISEFTVAGDPLSDAPDMSSEREIFSVAQPEWNHNGGWLSFGPDGYLYFSLGDGGGGGDPFNTGQDPTSLLAKIHRIDVDGGNPYAIPSDNPFVGDPQHHGETWAWGLRNPWRASFDRLTGEMWIGDCGQNAWEEIDLGIPGGNYGWSETEGDHCYAFGCDTSLYEKPVYEWNHSQGLCAIGGNVYRGCAMPDLQGLYFFSDWRWVDDSPVWTLTWDGTTAEEGPIWMDNVGANINSFGEDELGELYFTDQRGDRVLKIVPAGN
jgi:glucose/arabinose dehydrogenase